jgi:hypothetical protein
MAERERACECEKQSEKKNEMRSYSRVVFPALSNPKKHKSCKSDIFCLLFIFTRVLLKLIFCNTITNPKPKWLPPFSKSPVYTKVTKTNSKSQTFFFLDGGVEEIKVKRVREHFPEEPLQLQIAPAHYNAFLLIDSFFISHF